MHEDQLRQIKELLHTTKQLYKDCNKIGLKGHASVIMCKSFNSLVSMAAKALECELVDDADSGSKGDSILLSCLQIKHLDKDADERVSIYYSVEEQAQLQQEYEHELRQYKDDIAVFEEKKNPPPDVSFHVRPKIPKPPVPLEQQVKRFAYPYRRPWSSDLIVLVGQLLGFLESKLPVDPAIQRADDASRHISENVKNVVWRRDQGKCVLCGANERLEFDHIIPCSKGGSNTARNIQLLCENCNAKKSDKIG